MRIALFSEVFLPKVDGVVNTLCHLLDHLALRNHQSILFAPVGGPPVYANTPVHGLRGYPFPLYPELRLAPPATSIRRILHEFHPDLVHVINPVCLGIAGLQYGRKHHLPVVASYHTDIPGFARRWGWGFLSDLLWNYLKSLHDQADLNLAPSCFTYRDLVDRKMKNVKVWSRGVDTMLFNPQQRDYAWRNYLSGGHPDRPLLLYIGRLSHEKRVAWLSEVLKALPHVRLAIAGDGPQKDELQALFHDMPVVFTGFLQGVQLAKTYASADLFVFTGANETFGNVVLEAMACGLAVVAPASGGVLDLVSHRYNGLLYAAESITSLVDSVQTLLEANSWRDQLSQAAWRTAQARSWTSVLDGLLQDYSALIEQRRSGNAISAILTRRLGGAASLRSQ